MDAAAFSGRQLFTSSPPPAVGACPSSGFCPLPVGTSWHGSDFFAANVSTLSACEALCVGNCTGIVYDPLAKLHNCYVKAEMLNGTTDVAVPTSTPELKCGSTAVWLNGTAVACGAPPPPPSAAMAYSCTCTNGFSGADCSVQPSPPPPQPPSPSPPLPSPSTPPPAPQAPPAAAFTCGPNSVECATANCSASMSITSGRKRRLLKDFAQYVSTPFTGRRLQACGNGCILPKLDSTAVPSYPVMIETKFSSQFTGYATLSTGYQMAYGICYALGCNYRNVTVTYLTGDETGMQDFVYRIVFYTLPGISTTALPAALSAALPSTSTTVSGTMAYGMVLATGGALPSLSGVYPASSYTGSALPPAPPMASPPPGPPAVFSCTCTNGYSGVLSYVETIKRMESTMMKRLHRWSGGNLCGYF